ncbi:type II toxin-antitoxin system Phd/YefM family antitoxin [Herbihabitans rhizosphaerae]|uniref:type II toxin-antitoxin system Phd/YefM family antitoxin n=1 Tax=Herbihabitans rhizosphaerae TaxID=1872711 RepID=UPI00102BD686|nr:type II toxin-antitoxin system Phd/YefM family antitoxin [Herbihabitans rhizosphaerae]
MTSPIDSIPANLGSVVREVAYSGEEAIITDSGSEIAVIISMADYERLHEHADITDAVRIKEIRERGFASTHWSTCSTSLMRARRKSTPREDRVPPGRRQAAATTAARRPRTNVGNRHEPGGCPAEAGLITIMRVAKRSDVYR